MINNEDIQVVDTCIQVSLYHQMQMSNSTLDAVKLLTRRCLQGYKKTLCVYDSVVHILCTARTFPQSR